VELLRPRPRSPLAWASAAALLLAASLLAAPQGWAQEALSEQEIKAAYLYNFAKFVEWPSDAFDPPSSPLQVCVFGDDPFGRTLDGVIQGQKVGAQNLVALRPGRIAELRSCHVLFVSRSERGRVGEILASVRKANVLTVGEGEEFLDKGGMIAFVREDRKVRFFIEKKAVAQAPFKISSRLMALGDRRGNG
jgi:hypothetical protein